MRKFALFFITALSACLASSAGSDPASQFKFSPCDRDPGLSCFSALSNMYPMDNSKPRNVLYKADLINLKSAMKRYPDLDWSAVIDSKGGTGSTLFKLLKDKNVDLSESDKKLIGDYAGAKRNLQTNEIAEKNRVYLEGIIAYSKIDPDFKLSLDVDPQRAEKFQRDFDGAVRGDADAIKIKCIWNTGEPKIISPILTSKCGDPAKRVCLGQGSCTVGKSMPFIKDISCSISSNESCDATTCARSETGIGTKGCGIKIESNLPSGSSLLDNKSDIFKPNTTGVRQ